MIWKQPFYDMCLNISFFIIRWNWYKETDNKLFWYVESNFAVLHSSTTDRLLLCLMFTHDAQWPSCMTWWMGCYRPQISTFGIHAACPIAKVITPHHKRFFRAIFERQSYTNRCVYHVNKCHQTGTVYLHFLYYLVFDTQLFCYS